MSPPARYPALAAAAALAALAVVAVLALFSIQLWRAEGQRIEAARQEALARETDLALWRLEGRAAAIAAAPTLWPLDQPVPDAEGARWIAHARLLPPDDEATARADAWIYSCEPPPVSPASAPAPFGSVAQAPLAQFDYRNQSNTLSQSLQAEAANRFGNQASIEPTPPTTSYSRMLPRVENGRLTLLRRVERGGQRWVQEAELDLTAVTDDLQAAVGPALPRAGVRLLNHADDAPPRRRVAALPFYLDPGDLAASASAPTRAGLARGLAAGWAVVLAALALAGLALTSLVRLSQRRAAFVAAVTHEMRTPLTTFRLYTDLLADGAVTDPADRQTYLHTLRAQSVRLASLVDNVLTFARLERQGKIEREITTAAALLERSLPHLQDRAALDQMTVAWSPRDAADHPVQAAPALVEQILFNLVDNACKYGQNDEQPTIELTAHADATHVHLTLRDHGPGLRESPRDLFKPFVRTPERDADASPGVGLGLALSRRMARAMGGELRVAPTKAREPGACFELSLVRNTP